MRLFAAAVGLLFAFYAHGLVVKVNLALNSPDSTCGAVRTTAYPNGDCPLDTPGALDFWTLEQSGTAVGCPAEASETSDTEIVLVACGTDEFKNYTYVCPDDGMGNCSTVGSGSLQLVWQWQNDWSGNLVDYATLGCGIHEGVADGDRFLVGWWRNQDSNVRAKGGTWRTSGEEQPLFVTAAGASSQNRPRWGAVTVSHVDGTKRVWESSNGTTWLQVAEASDTDWTVAYPINAYCFGVSRSLTATIGGTLSDIVAAATISVYTPVAPDPTPPNQAPIVSSIPTQALSQTVSYSQSFTSYFSDPDGDTLTYSATGLPAGTGLTFTAATATVSGTPNASDLAASPFTVPITANDGDVGVTGNAVFTVSATPGPTLTISTGTSTINCPTFNSGSAVQPGTILQLAGGTHGNKTFTGCTGTAAAPIIVRNDPSSGSRATIRRATASSGGFVVEFNNSNYVTIDGTAGWSGNTGGCLPSSWTPTASPSPAGCGILITSTASGDDPSSYLRFRGSVKNITIKGVEVDGNFPATSIGGIGISISNDSAVPLPTGTTQLLMHQSPNASQYQQYWDENITVERFYIHEVKGEGAYIGPNYNEQRRPIRNVTMQDFYVTDIGTDGVAIKSAISGTTIVRRGRIDTTGLAGPTCEDISGGGAAHGLSLFEHATTLTVDKVWVNLARVCGRTSAGDGIYVNSQSRPNTYTWFSATISNSISDEAGRAGMRCSNGAGRVRTQCHLINNTIIDAAQESGATALGTGSAADMQSGGVARSNLVAGSVTAISVGAVTECNNRTGTVAAQNFTNAAGSDFSLTSSSPARNAGCSTTATSDFLGVTRPQGSAYDQGAYEFDE